VALCHSITEFNITFTNFPHSLIVMFSVALTITTDRGTQQINESFSEELKKLILTKTCSDHVQIAKEVLTQTAY
jgi:hypothetical protein